jgi:cytoskeletal protein RodZ
VVEVQEPVVEVHDPVVELQESEEEVVIIPVKKRKTRWLERIIFILIILGSIGLVAYLFRADIKKFYDQKFNKNNQVESPTPQAVAVDTNMDEYNDYETDSLEYSNSTNNNTEETANQTVTKVEPSKKSNNSNTTTKPVQIETNQNISNDISSISFEKGKFYVIAGSFGKKSDALQHIKDKKLSQYNPVLLIADSRVRVCIGTYKTEAEATAFAKKIDQTFWVLK